MRIHLCLYPTILLPFHLTSAARNLESVLLSKVKTLTLRKDLRTSHNRVPAVPQVYIPPTVASTGAIVSSILTRYLL